MADITGRTIETVDHPQNVGALGAAVCCGIGLGAIADFSAVRQWVPAVATYTPSSEVAEVYNRGFSAFKQLYSQNKKLFRRLNG